MAKRTGMPTITVVARELCRLITKFTPVIKVVTSNDPTVALALETALAACSALDEALAEYIPTGV